MITTGVPSIVVLYSDRDQYGALPQLADWFREKGVVPGVGDHVKLEGLVLTGGLDGEHAMSEVSGMAEVSEVVYDVKAGVVQVVLRRKG